MNETTRKLKIRDLFAITIARADDDTFLFPLIVYSLGNDRWIYATEGDGAFVEFANYTINFVWIRGGKLYSESSEGLLPFHSCWISGDLKYL